MSFLLLLLLFLVLWYVIWPLLRGWLFLRDVRQRVNDTFGNGQRRQRTHPDDEQEYTETGERKIFTSSEGEYADFEEVSGTTIEETVTSGETRTVIEEQVTDAEYEEIRD